MKTLYIAIRNCADVSQLVATVNGFIGHPPASRPTERVVSVADLCWAHGADPRYLDATVCLILHPLADSVAPDLPPSGRATAVALAAAVESTLDAQIARAVPPPTERRPPPDDYDDDPQWADLRVDRPAPAPVSVATDSRPPANRPVPNPVAAPAPRTGSAPLPPRGDISEKQLGAIYAIGRSKGLSLETVDATCLANHGVLPSGLNKTLASAYIDQLRALDAPGSPAQAPAPLAGPQGRWAGRAAG